MTDRTPATLDRLWDDIPTGDAPVADLLSAGHAAQRHRRRSVIAAAAAATALVLGGGALFTHGRTPAIGPVGQAADLTVRVDYSPTSEATALNVSVGHAAWNDADNTIVYVSPFEWSGACPPEGTADVSGGHVTLELAGQGFSHHSCTLDAKSVTATISGLDEPPTDIEVIDSGTVRMVDVDDPSLEKGHGDLTDEQYAAAVHVAQAQLRDADATITSATVRLGEGTVRHSNVGYECTSGRLLRIKLIGDFPHIVTTGHPVLPGSPPEDFTVHSLVITADAESGRVCLVGVGTGDQRPPKNGVVLDLG